MKPNKAQFFLISLVDEYAKWTHNYEEESKAYVETSRLLLSYSTGSLRLPVFLLLAGYHDVDVVRRKLKIGKNTLYTYIGIFRREGLIQRTGRKQYELTPLGSIAYLTLLARIIYQAGLNLNIDELIELAGRPLKAYDLILNLKAQDVRLIPL